METLIDASTRFTGRIVTDDDLVVEGTVEGNVRSKLSVTVAEAGHVQGEVTARDVTVHGVLEGNVWVSGHALVGPTGKILGDVRAGHLRVEDGGVLQGRILTNEPGVHREVG